MTQDKLKLEFDERVENSIEKSLEIFGVAPDTVANLADDVKARIDELITEKEAQDESEKTEELFNKSALIEHIAQMHILLEERRNINIYKLGFSELEINWVVYRGSNNPRVIGNASYRAYKTSHFEVVKWERISKVEAYFVRLDKNWPQLSKKCVFEKGHKITNDEILEAFL